MSIDKEFTVTTGSDNVFADLGLPEPAETLKKADLVVELIQIMDERKLTQTQAAKLIGIKQPNLSRILKGNFESVTYDALFQYLQALGATVHVGVDRHPERHQPGPNVIDMDKLEAERAMMRSMLDVVRDIVDDAIKAQFSIRIPDEFFNHPTAIVLDGSKLLKAFEAASAYAPVLEGYDWGDQLARIRHLSESVRQASANQHTAG